VFCFLDETTEEFQVDIAGAAEWFGYAVDQLMEADIHEEELPFMLFLCGAEAALRARTEDVQLH
jgi:hypothetical protein